MILVTFAKLGRALLLAAVLAVGFMVVGSFAEEVDRRLDGAWVCAKDGAEIEMRFNNGDFVVGSRMPLFRGPTRKGTYTTNNGKVVMKDTHVSGAFNEALLNAGRSPSDPNRIKLENKWYSVAEYIVALRSETLRVGVPEFAVDNMVKESIKRFNSGDEFSYVVDNKTLFATQKNAFTGEEEVLMYTKK